VTKSINSNKQKELPTRIAIKEEQKTHKHTAANIFKDVKQAVCEVQLARSDS